MAIDLVVTRFVQQNVGGLRGDLASLMGDFVMLEDHISKTGMIGVRAAAIGAVGLGVVASITRSSLQAAGEVQRVETGFMTVLKDANKVKELSKEVRDFDVKTPFSYLETAKATQMLLAAGYRGKELIGTMYAVGNATVAAGKGTDVFVRALSIMSKIKTSGTLTAVRVNQFASAGINIKDILKKQLGLNDDQMMNIGKLHLKADIVIPALIKGLNEKFKGGIEAGAKTYLGSLEVLQGSKDKLYASIGKTIAPEATAFIHAMTGMIDKVSQFVSYHPRITKTILALTAIGSLGALANGARIIYGVVKAKKALTVATVIDTDAEKAKAEVATSEALAIQGTGLAATTTAGKMGILARTLSFFKNPLFSTAFLAKGLQVPALRPFLMQASKVTFGGAVAASLLGALAGVGAANDMKDLGHSNAASNTYGVGVGAAAAVAAMFLPGAAVPIALAVGLRYMMTHIADQQNDVAVNGIRDENGKSIYEDKADKGSKTDRSDKYLKRADALDKAAEDRLNDWFSGNTEIAAQEAAGYKAEAMSARLMAARLRKEGAAEKAAHEERLAAKQRADQLKSSQREQENLNKMYGNTTPAYGGGLKTNTGQTTNLRNGETVIRIPERQADRSHRRLRSNRVTAAPAY